MRNRKTGVNCKKEKHLHIIKMLIYVTMLMFALAITCAVSIWLSYHYLTISHFLIEDDKITNSFRLVLLSDLHDHRFDEKNEELVNKVQEQTPDLIVIDGDMINRDSPSDETAVELVRSLSSVAPVYYSYGNHEYYYMEEGHDDLQAHLEEAGATVLNYQIVDIEVNGNPIRLGGLYEFGFLTGMQSRKDNERATAYLEEYADTDQYLIMCAHRPESFYCWDVADDWGLDLVLSGHLHGGQVILPFIGGLYSSLELFFPKYDFGQYKIGDSDMIITRGLSSNRKILPRINNPPEIAVIDIMPELNKKSES